MAPETLTRKTLVDLARQADVSVSTVSRALRGKPGASPALASKIRRLAKSMGYRPHAAARSLSTGRTCALTAVVRDLARNPYYGRVLNGIHEEASSEDYSVYLQMVREPTDIPRLHEELCDGRADGAIIALPGSYEFYKDFLESASAEHLPVAVYGPTMTPIVDSAGVDYVQAGRLAVDHLTELGHERIAHICTMDVTHSEGTRLEGFQRAIRDHGLAYREEWVLAGAGTRRSGFDAMNKLLKCDELPTGIVCHNDLAAIGAMAAIRQAGLSVPDDFSVIGFDNIEDGEYLPVPLTTVDQPAEEIGRHLVRLLLARLDDPARAETTQVRMTARLVRRKSTDAPRTGEPRRS